MTVHRRSFSRIQHKQYLPHSFEPKRLSVKNWNRQAVPNPDRRFSQLPDSVTQPEGNPDEVDHLPPLVFLVAEITLLFSTSV